MNIRMFALGCARWGQIEPTLFGVRCLLALGLGLLAGALFVNEAFAESIPATSDPSYKGSQTKWRHFASGRQGATLASVMVCPVGRRPGYRVGSSGSVSANEPPLNVYTQSAGIQTFCENGFMSGQFNADSSLTPLYYCRDGSEADNQGMCVGKKSCPSGGYTLSGSTCSRPDCAPGQVRNQSGSCGGAGCQAGKLVSGVIPASSSPTTICHGECEASIVTASNQYAINGEQVYAGTWEYSGHNQCVGNQLSSGAPSQSEAPSCGADQCLGKIGEQWSCQACSDSPLPSSKVTGVASTKTDSDGNGVRDVTVTTVTIGPVTTTTITNISNAVSGGSGPGGTGPATPGGSETKSGEPSRQQDGEEEGQPCGTSDFPCKIDEAGTPTGTGALDSSKAALDESFSVATSALTSQTSMTSLGWSFVPSLPEGSCQTVKIGPPDHATDLDVCGELSWLRDLYGWACTIVAAVVIWSRVTAAVGGGKG